MLVSVAHKHDKYCVMVSTEEFAPIVESGAIYSDISDNRNQRFLFALKRALLLLKKNVDKLKDNEVVVIEGSNSSVLQWFINGNAIKEYEDEFDDLFSLLCTIPCRIDFMKNEKPVAMNYIESEQQVVLSGSAALLSMGDSDA